MKVKAVYQQLAKALFSNCFPRFSSINEESRKRIAIPGFFIVEEKVY